MKHPLMKWLKCSISPRINFVSAISQEKTIRTPMDGTLTATLFLTV